MRTPEEISHYVARAALSFGKANAHVLEAQRAEGEEDRILHEARAGDHFRLMAIHLQWARATAFDVRKRNPEIDGYERCGHQHPSVKAAEECKATLLGGKPYGCVRVFGSPDMDEWWTPEQGRLQDFYRKRAHERAMEVATSTPPRKKLKPQEMLTKTGMTTCAIIDCPSAEAPADTRVCLKCHNRLYQEAEAIRAAQPKPPAPVPGPTGQLTLF